jgi:putative inorganic carbon (HCO3(-)) transporter
MSSVSSSRSLPAVIRPGAVARWIVAALAAGLLVYGLAVVPLRYVAACLLGTSLIAATLIQPAIGLVALAIAIPFGSVWSLTSSTVGVVDALVALILAAWLAKGVAARNLSLKRTPLLWPLAVFLWFGALSLFSAESWQQGGLEWLKWAEFAALYLVAAQVLTRRFVIAVLIALFSVAIYEVVLGARQFFGNVGPEAFAISDQFTRAYGTLQQPNPYAGYLGYLMPVALSLAISALALAWNSRRVRPLLVGVLALASALMLLAGIILSWSRGAWLGAAVGVLVVIAFRSRRTLIAAGAVLSAVAIVILLLGPSRLPAGISARVVDLSSYVIGPDPSTTQITDQNFSVLERLAHWQAGLRMFDAAPWIGIGIGNYAVAYPRFALPHWYEALGHAHNLYINFMAETGILGAVSFLVLWASSLALAFRKSKAGDPFLGALALGVLGTLAYLTVHNLFDNLFVQHLQLELALLLGATVALGARTARQAT